jgi:hypothetical protein
MTKEHQSPRSQAYSDHLPAPDPLISHWSLTLSSAALLHPPSPAALGPIGPSKNDIIFKATMILMTLARSNQT